MQTCTRTIRTDLIKFAFCSPSSLEGLFSSSRWHRVYRRRLRQRTDIGIKTRILCKFTSRKVVSSHLEKYVN